MVSKLLVMSTQCDEDVESAPESVLVTTDSCENFQKMSSSLEEIKSSNYVATTEEESLDNDNCNNSVDDLTINCSSISVSSSQDEEHMRDEEWLGKTKHVFVLSSAGKPIYSR